jgi:two-component system, NarL family, nitrate/nitrite response regulator NarL
MTTDRPSDSAQRVVVVDDHPVYRAGLTEAIGQQLNLELVSDAGHEPSTIEQILGLAHDVAVIGVNLPGFDGLRVLERLAQSGCQAPILVLSIYDGPTVYQALAAGAAGYLTKDTDDETICSAIAAVAQGESVFSPELLGMVARQIRTESGRGVAALSERQREILRLTAEGLSAEEVGKELALSSSTVKTHLAHAYEKLGVSCAPAAVCEAMRRGILS